MVFEQDPAQDLGLQHLLQNGLRILREEELGEERKAEVLEGLLEIVADADKGSEALHAENLTFALENAQAFERFSLIFRYLPDAAADLSARLSAAKAALQCLDNGETAAPEHQQALEGLLSDLLTALNRERALAPPSGPRELRYH